MKEKSLLEVIRRYTLWSVLGSAALLVILNILKAWDVISTTNGGSPTDLLTQAMGSAMFGDGSPLGMLGIAGPNAWGHLEDSLGIILGMGLLVLLAFLVSAKATLKTSDEAAKPAPKAAPKAKPAAK